jgi:hypothetical protein
MRNPWVGFAVKSEEVGVALAVRPYLSLETRNCNSAPCVSRGGNKPG